MPIRLYKIIALVVVIALAMWLLTHNSGKKSPAEIFKAELIAKGDKFNLAEIAVPPSTNENEVASRKMFATNQFDQPAMFPDLMKFVGDGKARLAW